MNCPICESSHVKLFMKLYDDRYGYPGVFDLLKCNNCDHKFLDARFNEEELTSLYTNYYPRSERNIDSFKPLEYTKNFHSWFNGEYRAYAAVPPNVRVLDIGCGFGESLGYHKNRGCEVHGVEADENIKRTAEKFGFNVKVGVFDAKNYSLNYFDFITMDQVIEHLTDPHKTLKGVNSILKMGGYFVFTTPNSNGWGSKVFKEKWINWHVPYHLQHFSKKSFRLLAEKNKFKIVTIETITSSEWFKYQMYHNSVFPENGKKAPFWNINVPITENQNLEILKVNKLNRYKYHHLVTRLFDSLGWGDNYLVSMQKIG